MKATKSVAPEVDAPELRNARHLADVLGAWNLGTPTRATLTADHEKALSGLIEVADAFAAAVPHSNESSSDERDRMRSIAVAVRRYVQLTRDTAESNVGGEIIKTPAIESPAIRLHVARTGEELISSVGRFIEARSATVQRRADDLASILSAIDRAKTWPILCELLPLHQVCVAATITAAPPPGMVSADEHRHQAAASNLCEAIRAELAVESNAAALGAPVGDVVDYLASTAQKRIFAADEARRVKAEAAAATPHRLPQILRKVRPGDDAVL